MLVLGHRGGRGPGWPPENTLDAFARAFREGADGVELDVRLCASGEIVLLHDRGLERLTGGRDRRAVHRVRRADLPLLEGRPVADLAAALDLCHGRIVNVELKADAPRRLALASGVARELARAPGADVVVSSFDPGIVLALAALAPNVRRGVLVGYRTPRLATALPLAMRRAIRAAHIEDPLLTPPRIDALVEAGLEVTAWTVNEPARAVALRAMGITTLITDAPGTILRALAPS